MQISSLSGIFQTMFNQDEQVTRRARPLEQREAGGDTVSFSEEALALARAYSARSGVQAGDTTADEDSKDENSRADQGMFGLLAGGGIVLNGGYATEADLAKEIQKAQEEVDALYKQLTEIMGMEGDIEEKIRQSEPVNKQLQDKLDLVSSLKGMQNAMKMNKQTAAEAKNPLTGG